MDYTPTVIPAKAGIFFNHRSDVGRSQLMLDDN